MSWTWNYRRLCATWHSCWKWNLGPDRTVHPFNHWAIAPALIFFNVLSLDTWYFLRNHNTICHYTLTFQKMKVQKKFRYKFSNSFFHLFKLMFWNWEYCTYLSFRVRLRFSSSALQKKNNWCTECLISIKTWWGWVKWDLVDESGLGLVIFRPLRTNCCNYRHELP